MSAAPVIGPDLTVEATDICWVWPATHSNPDVARVVDIAGEALRQFAETDRRVRTLAETVARLRDELRRCTCRRTA